MHGQALRRNSLIGTALYASQETHPGPFALAQLVLHPWKSNSEVQDMHPEVPTGTRTQPSWQAPLGNMHVEASFSHTAPSISIAEGRRSGSAVHHRCVTNDLADGKWSVHLLQVYAPV